MIFESAENICVLDVLKLLEKGETKYGTFFRSTKVSHTTLQSVLKELIEKKFVVKENRGHMDVDYFITDRGKKLLRKLEELKKIIP